MDFIERIFHLAPDGGSGSLELAILLVLVVFPAVALLLRKKCPTHSGNGPAQA
jgi:hypothetical protein